MSLEKVETSSSLRKKTTRHLARERIRPEEERTSTTLKSMLKTMRKLKILALKTIRKIKTTSMLSRKKRMKTTSRSRRRRRRRLLRSKNRKKERSKKD
jgi:hypothetical protein